MKRAAFLVLLMVFLAGCAGGVSAVPSSPQESAAATETAAAAATLFPCDCTAEGTPVPTGESGFAAAGPGLPAEPSPTFVNQQALRDRWETYAGAAYPFAFEYPAAYNVEPYAFCAPRELPAKAGDPSAPLLGVSIGSRTELALLPGQDVTLEAAVEAFRAGQAGNNTQYDPLQERQVGGERALVLPFRKGGTGRYSEAAFFLHDGVLYRIVTGVPSACDITEQNFRELDAYLRMLDSFTFSQ